MQTGKGIEVRVPGLRARQAGNFYSDYQKMVVGVTRGKLVNTCHKQERIWEEPDQ